MAPCDTATVRARVCAHQAVAGGNIELLNIPFTKRWQADGKHTNAMTDVQGERAHQSRATNLSEVHGDFDIPNDQDDPAQTSRSRSWRRPTEDGAPAERGELRRLDARRRVVAIPRNSTTHRPRVKKFARRGRARTARSRFM